MELNYEIIWAIIIIVFVIMECITFALVSIWFVLGAIIALILSICSFSFLFQFTSFVLVSTVSLLLLRPFAKMITPKSTPMNVDAILQQQGVAESSFDHITPGRVFIDGLSWRSLSSSPDTLISSGSYVIVDKIEGNTLYVSNLKTEPEQ